MMDCREYTFTLPDGSKRHELVSCRADIFRLRKMHGAIAAHPTDTDAPKPRSDGEGA